MTDIKLPSYRTIVPNEIFGKEAEGFKHPIMSLIAGKVPAMQLIRLARFRIPTQEEVLEFIRISAKGIEPYFTEEDKPLEEDSGTVHFLKSLSYSEVENIARGNKDSLGHLKEHCPKVSLQEGRFYLNALSGIVPNPVLNFAEKLADKKEPWLYEKLISQDGAEEWNLSIRLLESGKLPDRLELEYLLDRGVRDCDVFSAKGDFGSYQNVADRVRLFYNALSSPEIIAQIGDSSHHFLEQQALLTVRETALCVAGKKAIGGIVAIIGQALGASGDKGQSKPPINYPDCHFNRN